jgi:radical SAM superfamily enzyme YgiQ (UPF0313 family)
VLKKGISKEQIEKAFRMCRELHIQTLAYFMIGAPTETEEDIKETMDFALKLKPDYIHATIFTPYPETELYKNALENKTIKNDYWREFARDPKEGFLTPYWYEVLSREALFELLDNFYRRFYGRPSYILSSLTKIRSMDELRQKAKAGMKVLGFSRN